MKHAEFADTILVAGAGIGGLTVALALAKKGKQVRVLEQAPVLGEVGAGLQLSANAMKVMRHLDLEKAIKATAFAPQNATIRDYKSGEYYLRTPLGEVAQQRYGAPYLHIHRADLHALLVEACVQHGVDIELGQVVRGYRNEGNKATLLLDHGSEKADVIIGADGLRSTIRETMLGVQAPIFTGQIAWRGVVHKDAIKDVSIAHDACVWVGPKRHFVSYYLRGGDLINFVAVEERAEWLEESWSHQGDLQQLRRLFSGWHPEVTGILSACESTFVWALNGRPTLPKWHDGRAVLLGDACHPMLPFMAQGAAMAIEDAYVLANLLVRDPVEAALPRYEELRKPRATEIQRISRENAGLYHMYGGLSGKLKLKGIGLATKLIPAIANVKLDPIYGYDVTSVTL